MDGEERITSIGRTDQGRFLVVVTTLREIRLRVITAFSAPRNLIDFISPTKGREEMADKLKIPKFSSEAEEAQWWYDHRDELTKAFEDAAAQGELSSGSAARLAREGASVTPTTTIRLAPEDISRARALASRRGLRYQTYLKMLLHEALEAEEEKLTGPAPRGAG